MRGDKHHCNGEIDWFLIPADKRHAWWLHLTDAGQCKILGRPAPATPAYATPILYPTVSAHDLLPPIGDNAEFLMVPGSLEAKAQAW